MKRRPGCILRPMQTPPRMSLLLTVFLLAASLTGCGQKGELYLEPGEPAPAGQAAQEDDGDDGED